MQTPESWVERKQEEERHRRRRLSTFLRSSSLLCLADLLGFGGAGPRLTLVFPALEVQCTLEVPVSLPDTRGKVKGQKSRETTFEVKSTKDPYLPFSF